MKTVYHVERIAPKFMGSTEGQSLFCKLVLTGALPLEDTWQREVTTGAQGMELALAPAMTLPFRIYQSSRLVV